LLSGFVELDGGVHKLRGRRDNQHDAYLRNNGYIVVRFANADVPGDLPGVLARILQAVQTAPSPWPSSPEERETEPQERAER